MPGDSPDRPSGRGWAGFLSEPAEPYYGEAVSDRGGGRFYFAERSEAFRQAILPALSDFVYSASSASGSVFLFPGKILKCNR